MCAAAPAIGLVGKGIVYDTGQYQIHHCYYIIIITSFLLHHCYYKIHQPANE